MKEIPFCEEIQSIWKPDRTRELYFYIVSVHYNLTTNIGDLNQKNSRKRESKLFQKNGTEKLIEFKNKFKS